MKRGILSFLLIVLCGVCALGQQKFSATVKIDVTFRQSGVKEIYSYLATDLRSLNDVTITENSDYLIDVKLNEISFDNVSYYSISYSFLKKAQCTYRQSLKKGKPLVEPCFASISMKGIDYAGAGDLRKKLGAIITDFDASVLEPERIFFTKNRPANLSSQNQQNMFL